jgi:acyl-CoA synthetase (AMP-forming)/AMP-acid ligase II
VRISSDWNFAGRLVARLGKSSDLIDAATGETFLAKDVPGLIVAIAAKFLSIGLKPGDRVLISCDVSPASSLAYLGAVYAGCVPVLVDDRTLVASGDMAFTKARAKAAWTGRRVYWDWARKNGFPHIEGMFEPLPVHSLRPSPCRENDLAALMPTSGSSGIPRLVMVSHGNLIANTEAIIRSQHLGIDEKAMLIMPVSYCFGASILHTHLYQGGGVVFLYPVFFPGKILHSIKQ